MLVIADWRRDHIKPSVPLVWAAKMKETYESMTLLLDLIRYTAHGWYICRSLGCCYSHWLTNWIHNARVFSLLVGRLWWQKHFIRKEWSVRTKATLGRYNIKNMSLVDPNNILLPPLHIKLPAYLHSLLNSTRSLRSANTNPLSVPNVCTAFASRGFSVAAPTVWNSLPSGIRDSSCTHTFRRLLKTHCFQQAFGSPSGSPKCLRFGLWLTLCTLNIDLLTSLLTVFQPMSDQKARGPGRPPRSTSASYTTTTSGADDNDLEDEGSPVKMLRSPMSRLLYDVGHEMFRADDDSTAAQDDDFDNNTTAQVDPRQTACCLLSHNKTRPVYQGLSTTPGNPGNLLEVCKSSVGKCTDGPIFALLHAGE